MTDNLYRIWAKERDGGRSPRHPTHGDMTR